jgi:hypothetical protein
VLTTPTELERVVTNPDAGETDERERGLGEQLEQLVVRSVYGEMIGRPVDQVYRTLDARLRAADVVLSTERVWEYADSISDGTFELLR